MTLQATCGKSNDYLFLVSVLVVIELSFLHHYQLL